MTERRPFPPSPRRLALARQAGVTAASPLVVGAAACSAALIASMMLARTAGSQLGRWITDACRMAALPSPDGAPALHGASAALGLDRLLSCVLELAAPVIVAAALAALVAHVAQTRTLWLPRRRIAGAPVVPPARVARTALGIAAAIVIGLVAFGWLWTTAPHLAALVAIDITPTATSSAPGSALAVVAAAIASLVVAIAIAWVVFAALDALVRRVQLARALAMTVAEKREDDRLTAADPRWRAQRSALAREPSASPAVARAALVLLGDEVAVAIAWDARRQPIPVRTIAGRGARATQLLGLARRHRVAVHRDAQLAGALAAGEGPVPDAHWARLAEIIAAVQPSHRGFDLSR